MSRLIDADKLLENKFKNDISWNAFEKLIKRQQTVDAVEVVHGHWEIAIGYDPMKAFQCSECRLMSYDPTEFCPHCGAKMDKEGTV